MRLRDVPLKLDDETLAKVEALWKAFQERTPPGERVTQAEVTRLAVKKGVAVLELELLTQGYLGRQR